MCGQCVSLRKQIEQTQRASGAGLDPLTAQRIEDYARKLENELAAVIATPGHKDAPGP